LTLAARQSCSSGETAGRFTEAKSKTFWEKMRDAKLEKKTGGSNATYTKLKEYNGL